MDSIDDGCTVLADEVLIAVKGIRSRRGEFRLSDGDGLTGIVHIGMGSNLLVVVGQGLECNERGTFLERASIEVESHIDISVGVLCGEVCFRSDGIAVLILECLLRDLAVLVDDLLVEGAGNLVGLAGSHVVVVDGIADRDIFLTRDRLVTVGGIDGGGADNGSLHGNGLVNVVDILVVGNLDTVRGKGLEGYELSAGLDAAGIESEGHGRGTAFGFCREHRCRGDGVAVGILEGLLGGLVHKGSRERIGLPGGKPGVTDVIGDSGIALSGDGLAVVRFAHGTCRELRREHGHLLGNVILVLVLCELRALRIGQGLVDHEGLAREVVAVEGEIDGHGAMGLLCGEGLLCGHGLTVHLEHVTSLGIVNLTGDGVGLARNEVAVLHLVGNLDGADTDIVVAVGCVIGSSVDFRLRVIESSEVDGCAVAADGDGGVHQRIALVRGAAKLLDAVGVERHGTERVVGLDGIAGGGVAGNVEHGVVAEPETGGRVELGAVDGAVGGQCPVVRIGVAVMGVPRGRGAEIAVLIRHGDMGLTGGEGGHLEGHASKTVGTVLGLLGELKVGAVDLLGNLGGIVGFKGIGVIAIHNLLEANGVALKVPRGSLGLAHDDGAARDARVVFFVVVEGIAGNKVFSRKCGKAVLIRLERPRTGRLDIGLLEVIVVVVVEGIVVVNGELGIGEGGGTLREVPRAVVGLLAVELADNHLERVSKGLIADGFLCDLTGVHSDGEVIGGVVALRCLGLLDRVGASGQQPAPAGLALLVGGELLDELARSVVDGELRSGNAVELVVVGDVGAGGSLLKLDVALHDLVDGRGGMDALHALLGSLACGIGWALHVHIAGGMACRIHVHIIDGLARGLIERGEGGLIACRATASEIGVLRAGVHALRVVHGSTGKLAGEVREIEACDGTPLEGRTEPRAVDGARAGRGLRGARSVRRSNLHGILEVPLGVDGDRGVGELLGEVELLVGGGVVPAVELIALAGRGSGLLLTERLLVGLPVGNGLRIGLCGAVVGREGDGNVVLLPLADDAGALGHLGLVPVELGTRVLVVPVEGETLLLLLGGKALHEGCTVLVGSPVGRAGADGAPGGKVRGALDGRKRLVEVFDGCGHREHGTGTRLLGGIGKPGGAGRLEDEHCGHDRSEHLRFLDSSENLHVFFSPSLFAWFSVASLVVRLNCVSRFVLSLTEVISADSPGVVFLVLTFPVIVHETLVLRDFCIADALDGGFGVAHDAGNLIIRVRRVRVLQIVEHGDGATVDGLHRGIGVTQLLHGEEPLTVYQLIALPPQELFAVLLEPDHIVQLIWRDEEHGAPDLTGGGGNLGALKGHLPACVLRISVIPVLCEDDAVFLKGTEVEVPVGKDVRSLRAERLGVRLGRRVELLVAEGLVEHLDYHGLPPLSSVLLGNILSGSRLGGLGGVIACERVLPGLHVARFARKAHAVLCGGTLCGFFGLIGVLRHLECVGEVGGLHLIALIRVFGIVLLPRPDGHRLVLLERDRGASLLKHVLLHVVGEEHIG